MVDLGPLLCRAAGSRQIDGMDARKDGTHISPGFPPVMWAYVEERIRPWLAEAAATPGG